MKASIRRASATTTKTLSGIRWYQTRSRISLNPAQRYSESWSQAALGAVTSGMFRFRPAGREIAPSHFLSGTLNTLNRVHGNGFCAIQGITTTKVQSGLSQDTCNLSQSVLESKTSAQADRCEGMHSRRQMQIYVCVRSGSLVPLFNMMLLG